MALGGGVRQDVVPRLGDPFGEPAGAGVEGLRVGDADGLCAHPCRRAGHRHGDARTDCGEPGTEIAFQLREVRIEAGDGRGEAVQLGERRGGLGGAGCQLPQVGGVAGEEVAAVRGGLPVHHGDKVLGGLCRRVQAVLDDVGRPSSGGVHLGEDHADRHERRRQRGGAEQDHRPRRQVRVTRHGWVATDPYGGSPVRTGRIPSRSALLGVPTLHPPKTLDHLKHAGRKRYTQGTKSHISDKSPTSLPGRAGIQARPERRGPWPAGRAR